MKLSHHFIFEWRTIFDRSSDLLVSVRADTSCLVILGAVNIGTIVEGAIATTNGSATSLVHEVPSIASVGSVLRAFVLQEKGALSCSKLFQIPAKKTIDIKFVSCYQFEIKQYRKWHHC